MDTVQFSHKKVVVSAAGMGRYSGIEVRGLCITEQIDVAVAVQSDGSRKIVITTDEEGGSEKPGEVAAQLGHADIVLVGVVIRDTESPRDGGEVCRFRISRNVDITSGVEGHVERGVGVVAPEEGGGQQGVDHQGISVVILTHLKAIAVAIYRIGDIHVNPLTADDLVGHGSGHLDRTKTGGQFQLAPVID
ncbi:MAG: hypothetical protein A4E52_01754 [Pelotomaculum sp. PtaB.Bin013]|nr:MAG: hypothetical protein A4E52_01754 [Pelotomaculum sp. PtaB.Bin013]